MLPRRKLSTLKKVLICVVIATAIWLTFSLRHSMNFDSGELDVDAHKPHGGHEIRQPELSAPELSVPSKQLTDSGVPKIIHFIYRDTNVLMPYRDALETCTRFNKDWLIVLWTDEAIQQFMAHHFPQQVKAFAAFPHKIQRADAVRYLIMYWFGGVYMDMDMHCHRPLLPNLSPFGCFIDREREHQTMFLHGKQYSAMNSAMGCSPGHPFFKKVIDFVFHPDRVKQPFSFPHTIFDTTGPAMLTKLYDQWIVSKSQPPVTMLNETYFSPRINPRSGVHGACRGVAAGDAPPPGALSIRNKACWELKRLGFEKSDDLFITNRTVAIHQFTHLGYNNQDMKMFNVTSDFPQVKSYFQLETSM